MTKERREHIRAVVGCGLEPTHLFAWHVHDVERHLRTIASRVDVPLEEIVSYAQQLLFEFYSKSSGVLSGVQQKAETESREKSPV